MIAAFWGEEKSGKSTAALGFPMPIYHADFDFGFERISHRYKKELEEGLIVTKPYPIPMEVDAFVTKIGRRIAGVREKYEEFIMDYVAALQDKKYQTVVIDTATQLWEIIRQGFLQEKQELQEPKDKLRERLMPIEYAEPNSRMRQILYAARSFNKHLVLTHYARDEYAPRSTPQGIEEMRTGNKELDGFKYTLGLADIVIRTERKSNEFYGTVTTCGLAIEMEGLIIKNPSYEAIMELLKRVRGE